MNANEIKKDIEVKEENKIDLDAFNRDEEEKRPVEVEVGSLHLDPNNPRLAEYSHTRTQSSILSVLRKEFDLRPLADSMYRSGFFWEEPLVVVEEKLAEFGEKPVLVVIEGNRRLGALKTIHGSPTEFPSKTNRKRLLKVPVIKRGSREETLAYVGFRHITGIVPWESAAKAQYAHGLVNKGANLEEISMLIGDKTRDISRWVRTQSIVQMAREIGIDPDDAAKGFYFSYLLTATDAPATKKWLNLQSDEDRGIVESLDVERLKKLWDWLYGSKSQERSPVVPESRQIHKLNRIIGNPKAVRELEKTNDLEKALIETKSPVEYVIETLGRIRSLVSDLSVFSDGYESFSDFSDDQSEKEDAKSELSRTQKLLSRVKESLGL